MNTFVIQAKQLKKTFRVREGRKRKLVEAVRGIDLDIAAGEIFGLLGPNGAGKTTTMRMLCSLITPTSGTATVAGINLKEKPQKIREKIGYVGQKGGTEKGVSGRENLLLQARLHNFSQAQAETRAQELIDRLELSAFADRKTNTYSGGQRRIFDLAAGVIHKPHIMFLDEPTTGLDPQSRSRVWEEVKKLHADGTTIFLTTHYLEEADALCSRVAIVDDGKIVALGSPTELKRQIAGDSIVLTFPTETDAHQAQALLDPTLAKEAKASANKLYLYVEHGEKNLPAIIGLLSKSITIDSVHLARPTLDDVFLKLTGHTLRDDPNGGDDE